MDAKMLSIQNLLLLFSNRLSVSKVWILIYITHDSRRVSSTCEELGGEWTESLTYKLLIWIQSGEGNQ